MKFINRREFVTGLAGFAGVLALPSKRFQTEARSRAANGGGCWLTVCVPLVIQDPAIDLQTSLILTSASFSGLEGHADKDNSTEYDIELFDPAGNLIPLDGAKKGLRLSVPAMRTTEIKCRELLAGREGFWGGMRIRMLARGKQPAFVTDLFSAAFATWSFKESFDALHAHPDPAQLQTPDRYFSSMPFPSLEEYSCTLSLFNPYDNQSEGRITVYAADGAASLEQAYRLPARGSALYNLNSGRIVTERKEIFARSVAPKKEIKRGGSLTIENSESTAKNFAYMMIKGKADNSFAAEHTIHQGNYAIKRGASPFGQNDSFQARGWLYSAFIFNDKTIGDLQMSSRVYLSAGRPLEDELWLRAYASDAEGDIFWATNHDPDLGLWLPAGVFDKGAIKLRPFQSCDIDFQKVALKKGFAGAIGVACSPQSSHVLMKVEVRLHNWGTSAFSHFRPGARSARLLQNVKGRDGVVSDYIVSGVRLKRLGDRQAIDALLGVVNMEQDKTGDPVLEVFNGDGFVARKQLGAVPGYGCKHFLMSDLFPELAAKGAGPLTLRLIDRNAAVTLSALHIDHKRKDAAIDHGSDRFSTYEYGCA
ncbi:MAG TPA: hypothetical protein VF131_19530 [Blastocatellia bacterium]|nr:hypothetical protein [Blastocatellia bacterium]